MVRRTTTFRLLIVLTVLALLGLIAVQAFLLTTAMEQKDQAFRQNVIGALNRAVMKTEADEALAKIFNVAGRAPSRGKSARTTVNVTTDTRSFVLSDSTGALPQMAFHQPPLRAEGDKVYYRVQRPQRVTLRLYDPVTDRDTVIVDTFRVSGEYQATIQPDRLPGGGFIYRYTTDSSSFYLQMIVGGSGKVTTRFGSGQEKKDLVNKVVDRLVVAEQLPIERRVKPEKLDSLIGSSLRDAGISLPYAYGIVGSAGDSLRLARPKEHAADLRASPLRSQLFPADIFSPRNDLVVYFPGLRLYLLRQMVPLLGATVFFMFVIVAGFVYTVRIILSQKKLAGLMTDFINNMTHEFKTPISTVALAAEAVMRPDVIERQEKIRRYSGIILDENARMRKQVEKILQMAVLEKGEYELNMVSVDAHEVIKKAVESLTLQAESRQGKIECQLKAEAHMLLADPVHFANIINNILDNAHKYSPESMRINISTSNHDGRLHIRIEDHGMGIKPEHLKHVFDKYFRVPTGNLHDVKGFGLGLSYVRLMVAVMGGEVTLNSEFGKGTRVDLEFPVEKTTVQP